MISGLDKIKLELLNLQPVCLKASLDSPSLPLTLSDLINHISPSCSGISTYS